MKHNIDDNGNAAGEMGKSLREIELEKKLKVEPVTEIFKNVTEKTFEHVVEPFLLLSYCTQHFQRDLSMVMFETIFKRCDTRYLKLKLHAFIKLF